MIKEKVLFLVHWKIGFYRISRKIITLNEPYTSSADVMIRAHKQHVTIVRKSESSVGKKRKENCRQILNVEYNIK